MSVISVIRGVLTTFLLAVVGRLVVLVMPSQRGVRMTSLLHKKTKHTTYRQTKRAPLRDALRVSDSVEKSVGEDGNLLFCISSPYQVCR